jgi:hypothetical protein
VARLRVVSPAPKLTEIRLKRIVSVLYLLVIVATMIAWVLKYHRS